MTSFLKATPAMKNGNARLVACQNCGSILYQPDVWPSMPNPDAPCPSCGEVRWVKTEPPAGGFASGSAKDSLRAMADMIRQRFTPFAFTCECNGAEPDCYRTRTQDAYAIATHATIERIASFMEDTADGEGWA